LSPEITADPAKRPPPGPARETTPVTAVLKGLAAMLTLSVSTIVLTLFLCMVAIGKLLAPTAASRDRVRLWLAGIAETWIGVNSTVLGWYRETEWDIQVPAGLDDQGCYLVMCNHQSWVDIPVLQRCFNRRLPLLRFFLKSQLIWVPFLGPAWWALDFPFMKRASKGKIARRPNLKGKDLESARKACEKFREIPVAMMTFPEGTRFTPAKRDASGTSYRNLLSPRIGGVGQVLYALAEPLDAVIDVTIAYATPGDEASAPTLWELVCGQVEKIMVHVELREVPAALRGRNFREDRAFRGELHQWMEKIWKEKDARIDKLKGGHQPATGEEEASGSNEQQG
jgi:1-acyl-sn-glycerol-3-phosphate acyltransferase